MKDLPRGLMAAEAADTGASWRERAKAGAWMAVTVLSVCGALAWVLDAWFDNLHDAAPKPVSTTFTSWSFSPFADVDAKTGKTPASPADAAQLKVQRVWETGSLRGSDLDGDWGVWVEHVLQPSASLRRRFDYLLTALGEVEHIDLRQWIDRQVTNDIDADAAHQVLVVWDRYIALQQYRFTMALNPRDKASWRPALAERSTVRKVTLGDAWALAFYGDEERAFVELAQRRPPADATGRVLADAGATAGLLTPVTQSMNVTQREQLQALRAQQFGPQAAERLRNEDAAWAAWEQRLAEARAGMQAIARAPELSTVQRTHAQEVYLTEHFPRSEQLRARALLRVGS